MPDTPAARLARLHQRKADLERQIAAAERTARDAARKQETRRKIIVGGIVLAALAEQPSFRAQVQALLTQRVTRPHDRAAIADLLDDRPPPPQAGA